ncbi:MAG: tRNA pseudouridine(38-40) synthase TruA [Mycobacteriales bacterium]
MEDEPVVRVRLDLGYDGTDFAGWAFQHDQRTVQGELERALAVLSRRADLPRVTVAGRTDAGVHATGQVAHIDLPAEVASDRLLRRLNGLLPPDIRVHAAAPAPPGFDARFSGLARTYRYRVADRPEDVNPLRRHDTLAWPRELDLDAMRTASSQLLGLHDFAAFCRRREGATTVRTLLQLDWAREDVLVATVRADAFCHSMVRSLVGALLSVGEGRRPAEWPATLLSAEARASDVVVAPPQGLTLVRVEYPPDDQLLTRQSITRNLRV